MSGKSRWFKIVVGSLLLGVLIGGGITLGRNIFAPGAERLLKGAQETYAKGTEALRGGDSQQAAKRFDEANLQANKVLDAIVEAEKNPKNREGEAGANLARMAGQSYWLKARALRDHFFAQGIADGKPLPETSDSSTGEKFRSVFAIPDERLRGEAKDCMMQAGLRMTDDAEVQKEALRTELMVPIPNWDIVEKLARQTLKINDKDSRALGVLARFEYEQPAIDARTGAIGPSVPDKRSRERIQLARDHVRQLKETDNYPLWRTLFLEAEIAQWFRNDAANHSKSAREQAETETLRSLLLNPTNGAVARAKAGEGMERLSSWDVQGLLGLHLMALDMEVADSRKPGADTEKVAALLQTTLALCKQLSDKDPTRDADCAMSAIQAMNKAQPALVSELPPDWKKDLDLTQDLVRKTADRKAATPALFEAIASLLAREAHLEGKRDNRERRAELNKQALQWVDEGLKVGAESKLPPFQLATLNTLAAEMKATTGAKPEAIAANLAALREAKTPRATALADLLEAAAAEREGRLDKARKLLEQVLASNLPDLVMRAHMVLGQVYMALGQPDKALLSLSQTEKAYEVFDRLSAQEKAWALEFIRGPEDLALQTISANAESALNKARSFAQRNPGKAVPLDQLRHHETVIARQRKKLRKETPQDRRARQIVAGYYAVTGRKKLADKELEDLHAYYPNSVDVLRTEINLLVASPDPSGKPRDAAKLKKEADQLIENFLKDHPGDVDARYYWVEWLASTQRAAEAVTYLQSTTNFPDTKDNRYLRVLGATLLAKGDREGSQKVLQFLPHDANVDALLIQAASTADREKLVQETAGRYESNGRFQTWQAILAYNKRDYPAAADGFLKASQFTLYRETAKSGLLQSLLALAQTDPTKARALASRMFKESPEESLLLLASAYASLMLDDIGTPTDSPDSVKNMAATLNAWEQLALQLDPTSRIALPLTKATFWTLAGRQDLALNETVRALAMDAKNEAALRQAIVLALDLRDPDLLPTAQKRLDALKKAHPDNSDLLLLQAQLDERNEHPAEAVKVCESLLKKNPKLVAAYARAIEVLDKQGQKDKAMEFVRRWRKELPDDFVAAQSEVRYLAESKDLDSARRLAKVFIDEQTTKERKRLEAIKPAAGVEVKDVEKERKARLEGVDLFLKLQMVLGFMRAKAWGEVDARLESILKEKPDLESVLILQGDSYVSQKAWPKALAVYDKILSKNKGNVTAANNKAWMLAKHLKRAAEALPIVQELRMGRFSHKPIAGDRLRPEFLDTLGVVYAGTNKGSLYGEMRDLFESGRQRYPIDPRMCMYLGQAYAGLLETEKADRYYSLAAEIANGAGRKYLTPEKCKEVLDEIREAQKKLKQTAQN